DLGEVRQAAPSRGERDAPGSLPEDDAGDRGASRRGPDELVGGAPSRRARGDPGDLGPAGAFVVARVGGFASAPARNAVGLAMSRPSGEQRKHLLIEE